MTKSNKVCIDLFDIRSISKAIKETEKIRDKYDKLKDELLQKLCEKGIEIAQIQIVDFPAIFNGELIQSFYVRKDSDSEYAIVCDCTHAAFVEFGTGMVGKSNPYPGDLPPEYKYLDGTHYVKTKDGRYGWFYPIDEERKQWFFTEGMPARPFMFNTAQELGNIVKETAIEVLKNAK